MSAHSSRYTKQRRIGKGSFGEVWLVKDERSSGEQLVMKEVMLKGLPAAERTATMNEVKVLQRLKHDNIVAYRDSFVAGDKLCILMEYCGGGDLAAQIAQRKKQRGSRFSETEVLKTVSQLVSALTYCHHELKILHRDLKPANVFLSAGGEVKLGDFGISKVLQQSCQLAQTQCGTPLYMSPEMCRGQAYTKAADVWAVGCVLLEMMTLIPPWQSRAEEAGRGHGLGGLLRQISTAQIKVDVPALRVHYSRELCDLLTSLLARSPAARPSLQTITEHPLLHQRRASSPRSPPARLTPLPEALREAPSPLVGKRGVAPPSAPAAAKPPTPPLPPPPAAAPPATPGQPPATPRAGQQLGQPAVWVPHHQLPPQGRRIHPQRKPALPSAARAAGEAAVQAAAANLILRSFRARRVGAPPPPPPAPVAKQPPKQPPTPVPPSAAQQHAAAAAAIQASFRKSLLRRQAARALGNFRGAALQRHSRAAQANANVHVQQRQQQQQLQLQQQRQQQQRQQQQRQQQAAAAMVAAEGLPAREARRHPSGGVAPVGEVQRAMAAIQFAPKTPAAPFRVGAGMPPARRAPPAAAEIFVQRRPLPMVHVR